MADRRAELLPLLGDVFRAHGFEGASLALITTRTGLGKGSLYHLFPGGKEEMAAAVLADVAAWFETRLFRPLREEPDPLRALERMFEAVDAYFRSGQRICLVGAFALGDGRDRFAGTIRDYFRAWRDSLAAALGRAGTPAPAELAEEIVVAIQGALVTGRALDDPDLFGRTLQRLRAKMGPGGR